MEGEAVWVRVSREVKRWTANKPGSLIGVWSPDLPPGDYPATLSRRFYYIPHNGETVSVFEGMSYIRRLSPLELLAMQAE